MEKLQNILDAIEHLQEIYINASPAQRVKLRAQISSLLETRDQLKRNIKLQVY